MVYDSADHRNAADINATWHQLLEATHMKSANDPGQSQQPYEAVITMIKDMADRLNHSEVTFNPESIIAMIEKYAVEYQNNIGPRTWVVDLFIEVNIPFETIVTVLQTMWYSGLAPFSGPTQKRKLADHIVYTCEQWYEDCVRTNSRLYGSDDNAQDISELLGALSPTLSPNESALAEQIRRNIQRSFR
jgi:nuclear pore complex protein Nup155